mgnify:CR=1 FL=1
MLLLIGRVLILLLLVGFSVLLLVLASTAVLDSGDTTVTLVAPGFQRVRVKCWKQDEGSGSDSEVATLDLDASGSVTLHQLTPGVYTMTVEPNSWELLPKTVTVTVVKGIVGEVAVTLEPRPIEENAARGYGMGSSGYGSGGGSFGSKGYGSIGSKSAGEDYTYWGTNGFVETLTDRFSTFAVDVDTASYAIARRNG